MTATAIVCASGIYSITNTVNGKKYIGSAVNLKKRWGLHRHALQNNKHHSKKLQHSWNKYGGEFFEFSVIEYVSDKDCLIEREQYWIDFENSAGNRGYNISPTAGSCLGIIPSQEKREKIKAALVGRKRPEVAMKMLGYKHTPDAIAKMSAFNSGRKQSQRQIDARTAAIALRLEANRLAGIPHPNKGRKKPQEVIDRQKITISKTIRAKNLAGIFHPSFGKKQSTELIAKRFAIIAANRAKTLNQPTGTQNEPTTQTAD